MTTCKGLSILVNEIKQEHLTFPAKRQNNKLTSNNPGWRTWNLTAAVNVVPLGQLLQEKKEKKK